MSAVLYYSTYCDKCKDLTRWIIGSKIPTNDIHFVCIDKRVKKPNGEINVILENGSVLLLPSNIVKVPALLLLNKNNHVLFGKDIVNYLEHQAKAKMSNIGNRNSQQQQYGNRQQGGQQQMMMGNEPDAYMFGGGSSNFGVASDNYSYWDQTAEELGAQGNGGVRQMHNYVPPDHIIEIETPPDGYVPDKARETDLKQLQESRESLDRDITQTSRPNI